METIKDELIAEGIAEVDENEDEDVSLDGLIPTQEQSELPSAQIPLSQIMGWKNAGDPPSKDFVENVRVHGLYQPIVVKPTNLKKTPYMVVEGRRRLRALAEIGRKTAPVVIEQRESVNANIAALATNYNRSENVIGDARIVWGLLDSGVSEKQIAAGSGLKVTQVRALRDMRKLDPKLIQAVEDGKMRPWSARMAARLPQVAQDRLIDKLETEGQVTSDDVVDARRFKVAQATELVGGPIDSMPGFDTPDAPENFDAPDDFDQPERDVQERGGSSVENHLRHAITLLRAAVTDLAAIKDQSADYEGALALVEDAISTLTDSE